MVFSPPSDVKNNCSTRTHTRSRCFVRQNSPDPLLPIGLLEHNAATFHIHFCSVLLLKKTHATWLKYVHVTNGSGVKPLSQAVLTSAKNAPQLPLDELEPLSLRQRRRK